MGSVRDRLLKLEKELAVVKRELAQMKAQGGGLLPEWADLKTIGRMFGTYSATTIRYRIRTGDIPKSIVRKEGKKYLVNVASYQALFQQR